jgi:GxxExxY protein
VKDLTLRRQGAKNGSGGSENEIARVIVDACFHIHTALSPGLLESVYEAVLARELGRRGLTVHRRVTVPIVWEGLS